MIKECFAERIPGQSAPLKSEKLNSLDPQRLASLKRSGSASQKAPHAERKVRSLKRVPSGIQTSTHPGISYSDQLSIAPHYSFSNLTTIRELQREAYENCAAATQSGIPSSTYNHL